MSDLLYNWETRKYFKSSDLTKDGTKWIKRHRKELVFDENIEQYGDKRKYDEYEGKRVEFLRYLGNDRLRNVFFLLESGYNYKRIAYILDVVEKTIQRDVKLIKLKYKEFVL